MTFDYEKFEERAAIMEFEGGMPRKEAERAAAAEQGYTIEYGESATYVRPTGNTEQTRHSGQAARGEPKDDVSAVQRAAAKKIRSMPERIIQG